MKKLLMGMLLTFTTHVMAKEIDIHKAKGTEQSVINSLTPAVANMQVSQDIEIKVTFNVALNPKSIQKNEITLKDITQTKKRSIGGDLTYNVEEKSIVFVSTQPLQEGYYEISIKSLRTMGEEKDIHIGGIQYRFYVPEVINGYVLPPEPDPVVNNATLLGVDSNDNGIRDDVERWIIIKYAKDPKYPKTKTAIALQYAKASQYIIANDPEHAYENKTYEVFDYAMDCEGYWQGKLIRKNNLHGVEITKIFLDNDTFDEAFKTKMFNTRERTKAYWKFNGSLSGHMLGGGGGALSSTKDKCETDIDAFGEW